MSFGELGVGVWVHGGRSNGPMLLASFFYIFKTRDVGILWLFDVYVSRVF